MLCLTVLPQAKRASIGYNVPFGHVPRNSCKKANSSRTRVDWVLLLFASPNTECTRLITEPLKKVTLLLLQRLFNLQGSDIT